MRQFGDFRIGSLFSGVGGLELGLEWAGVGYTVFQVEIEPYLRQVLARHWPDVERFNDVRQVGKSNLPKCDLLCGGFPCQDISSAGKGAGIRGKRSGLWFEFARIIEELEPQWVVIENVARGAGWVDEVTAELGRAGYESLPIPLSATDVGAPHRRERIFLVACHTDQKMQPVESLHGPVGRVPRMAAHPSPWTTAPDLGGMADGIPHRMDRNEALGNSVVPQCAEVVGHVIRVLMSN